MNKYRIMKVETKLDKRTVVIITLFDNPIRVYIHTYIHVRTFGKKQNISLDSNHPSKLQIYCTVNDSNTPDRKTHLDQVLKISVTDNELCVISHVFHISHR